MIIGPRERIVFSAVQTVLLAAAVLFCAVMLISGNRGPGNVFVIAIIFLSLSLAGHTSFLFLSYRAARRHPRSP